MKKSIVFAAAALALLACNKVDPQPTVPSKVSLEPVITRALSLNFNNGDKIGLDIVKADGTIHAENALMTYGTTTFDGDVNWYADGGVACSLLAYYPYSAAGFPTSFTVESDQTAGTNASDFMIASKEGVYPSAAPILMNFKHQFAQIVVNITNPAGAPVNGVTIKGLIPTANIVPANGAYGIQVDESADAADIEAEAITPNAKFCAVVIPQSFSNLGVVLDVDGATIVTGVDASELKAGYSYTISVTVTADYAKATISGEIDAWEDGGELGAADYEPSFEEGDGYFVYDGQRYTTVTLSNGQTWMAEPLAYVPLGKTISDTPGDGSRYYYPYEYVTTHRDTTYKSDGVTISKIQVNGDPVAVKTPAGIKERGILYTTEGYLGAAVTADNFSSFEGVQGVCPKGWHIPSRADWLEIIGNSLAGSDKTAYPAVDDANALFYETAYKGARVTNVNGTSGLNLTLGGAIAVTTTASYGTLALSDQNCSVTGYYDKPAMTYYACSSASSLPTASSKMYFAVATTFSLGTYPEGRLSIMGSKIENAVQVRCIKDAIANE